MTKFTDHLILLDQYHIKLLLLHTIIIEVSLYCCDQLANFGTNTHKPVYIYCHLAAFYLVWIFLKAAIDNKYNSGLWVSVPKFATLSQYNETSIIMVCNSNNLIWPRSCTIKWSVNLAVIWYVSVLVVTHPCSHLIIYLDCATRDCCHFYVHY